jgi:TPR repeat protein
MATRDVASSIYQALGLGVTRSKRRTMQYLRKAANLGVAAACSKLARGMYVDSPHAREMGLIVEAPRIAAPAGVTEGHDVPQDVLTSVMHWLQRGLHNPNASLNMLRKYALEGGKYCRNEGCKVVRPLKDFKICPQCKTARYCSDACQKVDWNAGGHKASCGKYILPNA